MLIPEFMKQMKEQFEEVHDQTLETTQRLNAF
jgi:hypothetical protein